MDPIDVIEINSEHIILKQVSLLYPIYDPNADPSLWDDAVTVDFTSASQNKYTAAKYTIVKNTKGYSNIKLYFGNSRYPTATNDSPFYIYFEPSNAKNQQIRFSIDVAGAQYENFQFNAQDDGGDTIYLLPGFVYRVSVSNDAEWFTENPDNVDEHITVYWRVEEVSADGSKIVDDKIKNIYSGSFNVDHIYIGDIEVPRVYIGDTLVYGDVLEIGLG